MKNFEKRYAKEIEEERRKQAAGSGESSYSPRKMDCERIPLGCIFVVAAGIVAALYLIVRMLGR